MNENNVENQEGVQNNVTSSNIAPKGKLLPKIYNGAKKAGDIARKAFNFIKKALPHNWDKTLILRYHPNCQKATLTIH